MACLHIRKGQSFGPCKTNLPVSAPELQHRLERDEMRKITAEEMAAQGAVWPKKLKRIEDLPMPLRKITREEFEAQYPPSQHQSGE